MKRLILISCLACIYSLSFSQLQKGFVVLNNNEKIEGFISVKSGNKNPTKINFANHQEQKELTTYTINDLKSFDITDVNRYVRANVSTDARPSGPDTQVPAKLDTFRNETVWLRELASGSHVSLYELYDTRIHYFISDKNGEFKELIYKVGKEKDRSYNLKSYILQLQQYSEQSKSKSAESFMETKYDQYSLVKAVNVINGESSATNATLKRDSKLHFSVFAGVSVGTVKGKIKGAENLFGHFNFERDIFPFGIIGAEIYPAPKSDRFTIRLDFSFNKVKLNAYGGDPSYQNYLYILEQKNTIITSIAVLGNFINRNNLKVYIGPSATYHSSKYKGNTNTRVYRSDAIYHDYIPLRGTSLTFDMRAGVKLYNRLELGLKAELIGSIQESTDYTFSVNQYSAMIAYHFIKK